MVTTTTAARAAIGSVRVSRPNWRLLFGVSILLLILFAAVFGPVLLTRFDPIVPNLASRLVGPSSEFPLGTDEVGRDIWSRLLSGLRPSLVAGLAAVAVAALAGTIFGLTSGYFGGAYAAIVMRIMDVLLAWPTIFLALAIVLVFGSGQLNVILAIAVAETPTFARLIRSITIQHLHAEHVDAARSMGSGGPRIMRIHILPFAVVPLVVQLSMSIPQAVVAEASLSFLGLGAQAPSPSLGGMVSTAQGYLAQSPTYLVFPALAIGIMVLALTLVADGLQDALDPRHSVTRPKR